MNVRNATNLFCCVLVVAIIVIGGCVANRSAVVYQHNAAEFDQEIARVDDWYSLSMSELYQMMLTTNFLSRGGLLESQVVKGIIDSLVVDTLCGLKASQVRLEDHYSESRLYKLRLRNTLIKGFFEEAVYRQVTVDSQEVYDAMEKSPELFMVDDYVFLYHIFIVPEHFKRGPDSLHYRSLTDEQLEQEVRDWAYKIREMIVVPDSFTVVAGEYSHDADTQPNGGMIGWATRGEYYDPFDSLAFSMQPGDISEPYRDKDGWHIIYVEDRVPAGLMPLDRFWWAAEANVRTMQTNVLGAAIMDSLKNEINLDFNENILDKHMYYLDRKEWAAVLNGLDTISVNDIRGLEEKYRGKYKVESTTAEMKKEMLREVAERFIIVQAARKYKVDTLPSMIAEEQSLRYHYCKGLVIKGMFDPGWEPDESMVKFYFDQRIEDYTVEKPMTLQHIIVPDKATGEFLRDQANSGLDFLELAEEYYPGEKHLRRQLADLGQIGPGEMSEEFYHAALMTPVGEVSAPVKTKYGYHVIKVLERREAVPYSEARRSIIGHLKREHVVEVKEAFRDSIYAEFDAWVVEEPNPIHLRPYPDRELKKYRDKEE
ncbi:MAG: peptidylprolyl isomerase [candidate division Zixibacteria bacterium]|nr:peptidylprolyl isomerase [candidate division Zixibacteria bacterium]